jgi:hypothetical protein
MYASESQGDSLMRQKLARDSAAQIGAARLGTTQHASMIITSQFVSEARALPPPPSNWEDGQAGKAAGQYFSARRGVHVDDDPLGGDMLDGFPRVPSDVALPVVKAASHGGGHHGGHGAAMPPLRGAKASAAPLPPFREHMAQRQIELDAFIAARIAQSLDEQRDDDVARADACRQQRAVERMKLAQKAKQRIELQVQARQRVDVALAERLGIDVTGDAPTAAADDGDGLQHVHTMTADHRAGLRDVPTRTYLDYNAERLYGTMRHRDACLEAERQKAAARVALEDYVGTGYSQRRRKLCDRVGATGSTKCPTKGEVHGAQTRKVRTAAAAQAEQRETQRQQAEVTQLDNNIWAAESARRHSGQPRGRTKDINFSVDFTTGFKGSRVK